MPENIFLKTEGYLILFKLKVLESSIHCIDTLVEFNLTPPLAEFPIKSVSNVIDVSDWKRLIAYFNEHILALRQDPDFESHVFVPMELGFQLQALSGEVRSADDGEFSIQFMVNVGRSHEEASATYVGGKSAITLKNVYAFTSSLDRFLNDQTSE